MHCTQVSHSLALFGICSTRRGCASNANGTWRRRTNKMRVFAREVGIDGNGSVIILARNDRSTCASSGSALRTDFYIPFRNKKWIFVGSSCRMLNGKSGENDMMRREVDFFVLILSKALIDRGLRWLCNIDPMRVCNLCFTNESSTGKLTINRTEN